MYGYIYMTINKINGHRYIGQHKSNKFDRKYLGSGKVLWFAIRKYGKKNFKIILLDPFCETKEELDEMEKFFINNLHALDKNSSNYYNIREGGSGGKTPGRIWVHSGDKEHLITLKELSYYESQGYVRGRSPLVYSEEYRNYMREIKKAENLSDETRKKISAGNSGFRNGMYGQHHTEETRKKISKSRKGKRVDKLHNTGWVTDGVNNIRLPDKEIPEFLENHKEFVRGITHKRKDRYGKS